jgi:hypothetical protein
MNGRSLKLARNKKATCRVRGWWPECSITRKSGSSGFVSRPSIGAAYSNGGNRHSRALYLAEARFGAGNPHDVDWSKAEKQGGVKKTGAAGSSAIPPRMPFFHAILRLPRTEPRRVMVTKAHGVELPSSRWSGESSCLKIFRAD